MKQFKLFLMTALLSMVVGQAWGYKATVQTKGNGTVAINQNSTAPSSGNYSSSSAGNSKSLNSLSGTKTIYLWEKPSNSYYFVGWSTNSNLASPATSNIASFDNGYSVSISAETTYYAYFAKYVNKAIAHATTGGKVILATSNTAPTSGYTNDAYRVVYGNSTTSNNSYVYFYAKADEGYVFAGWATSSTGNPTTTTNGMQVNQKLTSTTGDTKSEYYAIFKPIRYGKATAIALTGGKVYATTSTTSNPKTTDYTGTVSATNSGAQGSDATLYLWATANDGYTFAGWSKEPNGSGDLTNVDSGKSYTTVNVSNIQGTTEAGATDGGTYYAVFKKNATSSFTILNYSSNKYLNASSTGLSLSSTKQDWNITSLGSSLFRVLTTSGNSSYNLCGMSSGSNIRVTSDHTTSTDKKYNCYFYEIADPTATTVTGTLTSEVKAGKYYFIDTQYSSTHYILGNTAGTSSGDDGTTLKGQSVTPSSNKISLSKTNAANCIYYIGQTATLEIGETGYATYSNLDFDIAVPSDGTTTLYGAKFSIDDEMVSLIELPSGTKAIKKGTGLVVKGTPGTTVTFLSATGGVEITGNQLEASGVAGTYFGTEKEIYILAKADGNSVVFKKNRFTSTTSSQNNLLAPNKAYLPAPNPPKSKDILGIDEPTTTGIESVNVVNSKSSKAYNINGVQVNKNYKGIIIKDGKKFFNR